MFDQNTYFRNLYDSGVRNKLVSMSDSRELQYAIDELKFGEYIVQSYPHITSLGKYTKKINTLETEKRFLERDIDDLLEEKSRIVQEKINGEWENIEKLFQTFVKDYKLSYKTPPNPFLVYDDISGQHIPNCPGVYFVYDHNGIIAYVGRSSCLQKRVTRSHEHIDIPDSISWLEYPHTEIGFAEAFYIGACRPYRNKENLDQNKDGVLNSRAIPFPPEEEKEGSIPYGTLSEEQAIEDALTHGVL